MFCQFEFFLNERMHVPPRYKISIGMQRVGVGVTLIAIPPFFWGGGEGALKIGICVQDVQHVDSYISMSTH